MRLLVAAAVATMAALLELTVAPRLGGTGPHVHPVLVLGVAWTLAAGADSGLVGAFVGGLVLDALAQRPLGATAAALLVTLAGVSLAAGAPLRTRRVLPILLVPVAASVASVTLIGLLAIAGTAAPLPDELSRVVPGIGYDTALAALVGPVAVMLSERRHPRDPLEL
jgi:rod shape-determining protein MreD